MKLRLGRTVLVAATVALVQVSTPVDIQAAQQNSTNCRSGSYFDSNKGKCVRVVWEYGTYLSDDYEGFEVAAILTLASTSSPAGYGSNGLPNSVRPMLQIDCPTESKTGFYTANKYKISIRQTPEIVDFGSDGRLLVRQDKRPWSTATVVPFVTQPSDPESLVISPALTNKFVSLLSRSKSSISIRIVSITPKAKGWTEPSLRNGADFGTFEKKNFPTAWKKLKALSSCRFGW